VVEARRHQPGGSRAGGPLSSIAVADALLDERRELTDWAYSLQLEFSQFLM
jgi:hypothetical protein